MYISIWKKTYENKTITELSEKEFIELIDKTEEELLGSWWIEIDISKISNPDQE